MRYNWLLIIEPNPRYWSGFDVRASPCRVFDRRLCPSLSFTCTGLILLVRSFIFGPIPENELVLALCRTVAVHKASYSCVVILPPSCTCPGSRAPAHRERKLSFQIAAPTSPSRFLCITQTFLYALPGEIMYSLLYDDIETTQCCQPS